MGGGNDTPHGVLDKFQRKKAARLLQRSYLLTPLLLDFRQQRMHSLKLAKLQASFTSSTAQKS